MKAVPGYEGYFADEDGNVYSAWIPLRGGSVINLSKLKRLKPSPKRHGYMAVTLVKSGQKKTIYVHQIVMMTFHGTCPKGMEVCHWDGNKANNRLSNLRYDTRLANKADNKRNLSGNIGERNNTTKLTEGQVRQIRLLVADGFADSAIAPQFNVSRTTIYSIRTGKHWEWLR